MSRNSKRPPLWAVGFVLLAAGCFQRSTTVEKPSPTPRIETRKPILADGPTAARSPDRSESSPKSDEAATVATAPAESAADIATTGIAATGFPTGSSGPRSEVASPDVRGESDISVRESAGSDLGSDAVGVDAADGFSSVSEDSSQTLSDRDSAASDVPIGNEPLDPQAAAWIEAEWAEQRVAELTDRLSDPDVDTRFAAVVALAGRAAKNEPARRALISALGDSQKDVVLAAQRALRQLGAAVVPELVAEVEDKESVRRLAAVRTLSQIDGEATAGSAEALRNALQDEDPNLRAASAAALGKLAEHAPQAVPALIDALGDPDDNVRTNAARALGAIGAQAAPAISALRKAAEDENYWTSRAAKQALRSIAPGPRKKF